MPGPFLPLALTEFWERFALAGVKSLLTLMLVDHILSGDRPGVIGAGFVEAGFESIFGAMPVTGFASQLYGLTTALLYLCVPLGGLVGDRITGRRGAVWLGGGLMLGGLALMISGALFLPGLALFALGGGTIKGNLSVHVGSLFADSAERRRGFAIYLGFLNAGMICGPLLCGAAAAFAGWQAVLGVAAAGIALGLAGYWRAVRRVESDAVPAPAVPSAREEPRVGVAGLIAALLAVYLCFAAYEQIGNIFLVWARSRIDLGLGGWQMPVAWLISIDGAVTLALIPGTQWALRRLADRGWAVSATAQIALGCLACMAGNLLLAGAALGEGAVPLAVAIGYIALIDLGVVLVWPAGLSLMTGAAPWGLSGLWAGLFYLHGFFANLWVGFGGAYFERMPAAQFWLIHAGIALAGAMLAGMVRGARPDQATTTSACAKAAA